MEMNWDDPAARAALITAVGAPEFSRRFAEHRQKSVVSIVNGYKIYPVGSRWGRLYAMDGTDKAFQKLEDAEAHARTLPKRAFTMPL